MNFSPVSSVLRSSAEFPGYTVRSHFLSLTVDAASVDDGCADARHAPGGAVRVAGGRLAHADDGAVEHRDELVRSHLVHV